MRLKEITGQIVDAAMKVHSALGPSLLENAHKACLVHELRRRGLKVQTEVFLPVVYDGERIDLGYRIDVLVEDEVVVELKAVEALGAVHKAQIISYLKLSGKKVGLLINFKVAHLRDGIRRVLNGDLAEEELFPSVPSVSSVVKSKVSSSSK